MPTETVELAAESGTHRIVLGMAHRGRLNVIVHTLGRPPRRLTLLHLDGSENRLPAPGSAVLLGDREVGFIGSSARHFELGPIGLGLLKRNALWIM